MSGFDFSQSDVLIIDDQEVIRGMVRGLLIRLGVRNVTQAADGAEGLLQLGDTLPSCVLCDINMKRMNGLEFLKTIRSGNSAAPHDLPVALLTGHSDADIVDTALALDASAFILKPVSGSQLGARLTRVLGQPMQMHSPAHYGAIDLPNLKAPVSANVEALAPASTGPGVGVRLTPPPPPPSPFDTASDRKYEKYIHEVPAGAVLAEDLRLSNGRLLLSRGKSLSQPMLDRLNDLVDVHPCLGRIWIKY